MVPFRYHAKQEAHHLLAKGNLGETASKSLVKFVFLLYLTLSLIFDTQLPLLASDPAVQLGPCISVSFESDFCQFLWIFLLDIPYASLP